MGSHKTHDKFFQSFCNGGLMIVFLDRNMQSYLEKTWYIVTKLSQFILGKLAELFLKLRTRGLTPCSSECSASRPTRFLPEQSATGAQRIRGQVSLDSLQNLGRKNKSLLHLPGVEPYFLKILLQSTVYTQQLYRNCSFTTAIQLLCVDGTLQENFVTRAQRDDIIQILLPQSSSPQANLCSK